MVATPPLPLADSLPAFDCIYDSVTAFSCLVP
jgi:hypothetical protein